MLIDTNDESWRNDPLPPPPNQPPAAPTNRAQGNAALITATTPRAGKKKTKASIKLAALNIRGNGKEKKWWKLNQIINHERIGMLIVGEAHLDEERLESIDRVFKRQLLVKYSKDPRTPNANGVAIVVNRNQLKVEDIRTREVIPGRALLLETVKHDGKPLSILGVYAPNTPSENAQFWKDIQGWFTVHSSVRKPDVLGGDKNVVEDAIDRLPAHEDSEAAVSALDDLKGYLNLVDGWRETFPTTKVYTYHQVYTGSQSRLRRFYVKRDLMAHTYEWEIETVGIRTDHRMITMKLTSEDAPSMGHGRWVCPPHIMRNKNFKKFVHEAGMKLINDLLKIGRPIPRTPAHNEQTVWKEWKDDVYAEGHRLAKIVVPKMDAEIEVVEQRLKDVLADDALSEEERKLSGAVFTEHLAALHRTRFRDSRKTAQARNRLEGEVISKYWSMINKPRKPRDIIDRLLKDESAKTLDPVNYKYETNSKKMATMARNYHNKIQKDRRETAPDIRDHTIDVVLTRTARKASEEHIRDLSRKLTREDVQEALKLSANGKAPGLSGFTYEFWKILDDRFKTAVSMDKEGFDIIRALLFSW
ncbi:Endonuclease/exonuclease/phosphatase [Mycena albidolilacea]|uniref:Endonuclease/exonuclease/phosphatase n=1 Tax=Mycena albidolilacea TaxID=1033008 RepID=A0AAD6ZM09_9AGAR|nr:Endonuclease/exonuclease/phosphatase [Mycena albidolilacea]